MTDSAYGMTLRFKVTLDGLSLGDWTKCEGLVVEYDVEEFREGGENGFVHRLPGRAKYQNIKLTRPIDGRSGDVFSYLAKVQTDLQPQPGEIELRGAANQSITRWKLQGVFPVKWTGPTMDLGSGNVAVEVLELAHQGFAVEPSKPHGVAALDWKGR